MLPTMAGGDRRGKCPHGGSPHHVSAHRPLDERGQASPPPPTGHCRCLGKFPSGAVVHQGQLLHHDADFPHCSV
jgi:hypothetical protein